MNAEEIYKRNKGEVYYDSRTDSYGNKILIEEKKE